MWRKVNNSIIGNIVTHLVPSIKKNMMDAMSKEEVDEASNELVLESSQENELQDDPPKDQKNLFNKRRRKTPIRSLSSPNLRSSVKNATAAEILLRHGSLTSLFHFAFLPLIDIFYYLDKLKLRASVSI